MKSRDVRKELQSQIRYREKEAKRQTEKREMRDERLRECERLRVYPNPTTSHFHDGGAWQWSFGY